LSDHNAIFNEWKESKPVDRKFLEIAVAILLTYQDRLLGSMIDSQNWLGEVKTTGIDSERYFSRVVKQYKLLAHKKREGFKNITLERFITCLIKAN
jgi:hypothetical protein